MMIPRSGRDQNSPTISRRGGREGDFANIWSYRSVPCVAPVYFNHDGFAFALAERSPGCILLTGDGGLWKLGLEHNMEVRGLLWIIDEIHANGLATTTALMTILRRFGNDPTVRLPRRELAAQIKRYEKEE